MLSMFSWDCEEFVDKENILKWDKNSIFISIYWSNFSGLPENPENDSKIQFILELKEELSVLKLSHSEIKNLTMYEHSKRN